MSISSDGAVRSRADSQLSITISESTHKATEGVEECEKSREMKEVREMGKTWELT